MGLKPKLIFTVTNDLNFDQRMHRICNSLHDAGYEVLLVGRKKKSSKALLQKKFRQKRLGMFFQKGKLFYAEYNLRLIFYLLFQNYEAVCAIDLDTIVPCILISKLKSKKIFYDAHELFSELPEVFERPAIRRIWKGIEKFAFKNIDAGYTVTTSIADYFQQQYHFKLSVVRNLPVKTVLTNTEVHKRQAVYLGNLNIGRGIEEMMEAMPKINCDLLIVGDGELKNKLQEKAQVLSIQNRVTFSGSILPHELDEKLQQSKVGLCLIQNLGVSYYLSLSNKFFDYMMAGVPSVAMNWPEFKKINDEYGISVLIDDLKPESISKAFNLLFENDQVYKNIRQKCMEAREILNWENEAKILLDFYARNL